MRESVGFHLPWYLKSVCNRLQRGGAFRLRIMECLEQKSVESSKRTDEVFMTELKRDKGREGEEGGKWYRKKKECRHLIPLTSLVMMRLWEKDCIVEEISYTLDLR